MTARSGRPACNKRLDLSFFGRHVSKRKSRKNCISRSKPPLHIIGVGPSRNNHWQYYHASGGSV